MTYHSEPTQGKDEELDVYHYLVIADILGMTDGRKEVEHAGLENLLFCGCRQE